MAHGVGDQLKDGETVLYTYADGTTYYKVVIRVWLEGEDKTCNNTTFANLADGTWSLSTAWTLGTATAVQKITEVAQAVTDLTAAGVSVPDDAAKVVINGVTYTKITGATVNSLAIYTNNGTISKTSRIFTIDGQYPTDVTNMVKLPTA